jgi:hypothetical protein
MYDRDVGFILILLVYLVIKEGSVPEIFSFTSDIYLESPSASKIAGKK